MKFSTVFSIFLAALSVGVGASPIPLDQPSAITRGTRKPATSQQKGSTELPTTESNTYKAVAKVGKNLQPNKYYAFYITNTLKSPPVKEEAPHINEARKQLGYQHIYYGVGKVTKTTKGGGKNKKEELGFGESMQWDLGFKDGDDHPITYATQKWDPTSDKRNLHFVGEISEKEETGGYL
ncbi:hypothetical protein SI65_03375 [Aspergillus cristatus]|uniref:Uncharacterized protein n=1 Tax=Aspergillus cristatus TaxID=573508 RepID=A0A1E3BH78_ASPCR|nr:hypothetical protein SI65_03375 [Aspergillus cristatus]